ncbi:MAG: hypothetical protein R6U10_03530 [Thermoplasmatota archaeon]
MWGSIAVGVVLTMAMVPLSAWTGCMETSGGNDAVVVVEAVTGGYGLAVTVANEGPADAEAVTWNIDIQGSLWPSGYAAGTIASLPAGEQTTVRSAFFLGLGPADIMVRASGDIRHGVCHIFGPFTFDLDMVQEREEAIPADAVKGTPASDVFTPVVHSEAWQQPVPLPGPVNTAGAEDACFVTLDGTKLYFFFTPDVDVPASEQLLDGVTRIWQAEQTGDTWTEPERVILNDDVALDGAPFVQDDTLWFASFRAGNIGDDGDMYTAERIDGTWLHWENAGQVLNDGYNIGEMHLTADGRTMYFHRSENGHGGLDLWTTTLANGTWTEPVSLGAPVNSPYDDSRPWISPDGIELWFTRPSGMGYPGPAVYRSVKTGDGWSEPEEIVSNFAGEPCLDGEGNIYFVHHFFSRDMEMIEADIYVCYPA